MNLKLLFPFASDETLAILQEDHHFVKNDYNICKAPTEECDVICPVDEITGHRLSRITQVMNPNISPLEKERLLSTLQRMSQPTRSRLNDEDLIALTPSRYNSSLVDQEKFASYLRDELDLSGALDDTSSEPTAEPNT